MFFRYLLASPTARKKIIVKGAGAQHFNIGQDGLSKVCLNIPSIQEQEKIAKLFECIDTRIATQNKIIEDLKKLKSAISLKMLHSDSWEQFKIQDIASIGRGRVISSVEISQQENPLYPVYSSQTSNDGIMGYLDDFMFEGEYISWYDFAREIFAQAAALGHEEYDAAHLTVKPVTTAEYGASKAARPFNSRLDKSKLTEQGFTLLPTWQDALTRYLQEVL